VSDAQFEHMLMDERDHLRAVLRRILEAASAGQAAHCAQCSSIARMPEQLRRELEAL
jgi:hypothetical protein